MSKWVAYNNGQSIGSLSAEGSVIIRDEEHTSGARVTLKRGEKLISVSCNVYGWIDHTRFFNTLADAQREYSLMKSSVGYMVENILAAGKSDLKMWEAIAEFVRRFP
jgi:hypothetical protein